MCERGGRGLTGSLVYLSRSLEETPKGKEVIPKTAIFGNGDELSRSIRNEIGSTRPNGYSGGGVTDFLITSR